VYLFDKPCVQLVLNVYFPLLLYRSFLSYAEIRRS